jgi:hypothetical protein
MNEYLTRAMSPSEDSEIAMISYGKELAPAPQGEIKLTLFRE